MKILIAYATTDGQTRKIARFAAHQFADAGHAVELLNVEDAEGMDVSRFGGVVVAGSLHAGGYQKALVRFVVAARDALAQLPTLMLPVSLSAAGTDAEDWAGLKTCLAEFLRETGWTPGRVEHVAGAFRFSEYDFFRAWAMRRIADQKGQKVEPEKDLEYTDWSRLGAVLDEWVAGIGKG